MTSYTARCLEKLKLLGAPLEGWRCVDCLDMEDASFICELCGCSTVRYVHVMVHDDYEGMMQVGCICAGMMEGDILAARAREKEVRNRSKRRRKFMQGHWKRLHGSKWMRTWHGRIISVYRKPDGSCTITCGNESTKSYRGAPIMDAIAVKNAAFELVDR